MPSSCPKKSVKKSTPPPIVPHDEPPAFEIESQNSQDTQDTQDSQEITPDSQAVLQEEQGEEIERRGKDDMNEIVQDTESPGKTTCPRMLNEGTQKKKKLI